MRFISGLLLVLLWSCNTESQVEKEISKIDITLEVERFDRLYSKTTEEEFPDLKASYPFLFSNRYSDSLWLARINDSLQKQLRYEVENAFEDFSIEENEIISLFQHLKYYDNTFKIPRVITVTNDVDYKNKAIVTDTIVLIALDNYLGTDHEFYGGIQNYLKKTFNKTQIVSDLTSEYGKKHILMMRRRTLLDDMINSGKILFFKDLMIPFKSDAEKIGYSNEELQWAIDNESNIWSNLIENELLFSTEPKLVSRFIDPAPFTKFGLELDNQSPGRLGQYMGWQIVRAYMNKNDFTWQQLFDKDPKEIFNNSQFKPRK